MNTQFTVYDALTGEVLARNSVAREEYITYAVKDGQSYVIGEAPEDSYVDVLTKTFADRPTLPEPSDNYDLTALPSGTVVKVTDSLGTEYEITDLSEDLILEGPETYQFQVKPPFPYIPIRTTVEVA